MPIMSNGTKQNMSVAADLDAEIGSVLSFFTPPNLSNVHPIHFFVNHHDQLRSLSGNREFRIQDVGFNVRIKVVLL